MPLIIRELALAVTGSDNVPGFLSPFFVGLLKHLDKRIVRPTNQPGSIVMQRKSLVILQKLLGLMGPHLGTFMASVITILSQALQQPKLVADALVTWHLFIQLLAESAPAQLKAMASQIMVAILPCLEVHSASDPEGGNSEISKSVAQDDRARTSQPLREEDSEVGQSAAHVAAVAVLEELVVKNRDTLGSELQDLPLLPSLPELAPINLVLQESRGELRFAERLQRAADMLGHEALSVRFTAAGELRKLFRARRGNPAHFDVESVCPDQATLSRLVSALLRGCAEQSRTSHGQQLKLLCAECLGDLGAVDPAKLHVELRKQSKMERSNEDLVWELITEHLAKVLRAAYDTETQDAAALAIQELLKYSGCHASLVDAGPASMSMLKQQGLDSGNQLEEPAQGNSGDAENSGASSATEMGERLWGRFDSDVRDIIAPCLTSKYSLLLHPTSLPSGPIFSSSTSDALTYRRWITTWCRRLISHSTGSRRLLFSACQSVIRHDMGSALFILPYLVLNVVCDGTAEARAAVIDEILAVLADCGGDSTGFARGKRTGSETATSQAPEADPGTRSRCVEALAEVAAGSRIASTDLGNSNKSSTEVITQTIFTLLDCISQWLDDCKHDIAIAVQRLVLRRGDEATTKEHVKHQQTKVRHVEELLAAVPEEALARASFRCQAYARALQYFESHVRKTSGTLNPAAHSSGQFEDPAVSFFLEIYRNMDEPDGLAGLSRLRASSSWYDNLRDQILVHEKEGNWAEALTCYEQVLEVDPRSSIHHGGLLNCFLNMGHLQAMVTHVDGLLSRMPECSGKWSAQGVQAAWRLGQWDRLDEYVHLWEGSAQVQPLLALASRDDITGGGSNFDLGLAKVLQALRGKDTRDFQLLLRKCRRALLVPLAAAGMESYSRAYPHVVKLQMLQELEDCSALSVLWKGEKQGHTGSQMQPDGGPLSVADEQLASQTESSEVANLLEEWAIKLSVTQPSLSTREPILALRRLLYRQVGLDKEVGTCWLQYARMCRKAGHHQTANRAILEARHHQAANVHLETAKLLWAGKRTHMAITELQGFLQRMPHVLGEAASAALGGITLPFKSPAESTWGARQGLKSRASSQASPEESPGAGEHVEELNKEQVHDGARTLLLLTRWVHHTGQKQKQQVLTMYHRVRTLQPQWEKSYFSLAKYYDDLYLDAKRREEESGVQHGGAESATAMFRAAQRTRLAMQDDKVDWWTYQADAMLHYAKALRKGHKYLFQSMPRLLTLWFDFGAHFTGDAARLPKAAQSDSQKVRLFCKPETLLILLNTRCSVGSLFIAISEIYASRKVSLLSTAQYHVRRIFARFSCIF